MKLCRKCLKIKPLTDFYAHPKMADGHLNKCKDCAREDVTENRAARHEYYLNYDRVRYDNDNGRRTAPHPKHNEYSRKWSRRNVDKKRAEQAVAKAIREGRMIRPNTCVGCGLSGEGIEAHHEDYSKPLDVTWLCAKCHGDTRKKPRVAMDHRAKGGHRGPMQPTRAA